MRNVLEKLLRSVDIANPATSQQRWDDYRVGANSSNLTTRSSADAAFCTLIAWHGPAIYRHIWGFVRSDAADDVFQDVLRKLHEHRNDPQLASFQDNVLPWLRRVAIHQCLDAHRSLVRRNAREKRVARSDAVENSIAQGELNEALTVALGRLPEELQQVIALHFFEGMTQQSAAATLGIHRDTFSARIKTALELLRKQIPFPSILLGGTLGISSILAAEPPPLTSVRIASLVQNSMTRLAISTGTAKSVLFVTLTVVGIGGGIGLAEWSITQRVQPRPRVADNRTEPSVSESFQERNIRLVKSMVIPELMRLSRNSFPEELGLQLVDVRAFGSEVECEFRTARPILPDWKPSRLNIRYCILMRYLEVKADLKGGGNWKVIDPNRPIILDLAIPGIPALDLARENFVATQAAFDRLPGDDRAEQEQVRLLFGDHPKELLIPAYPRGFAADEGRLYLVDENAALYIREPGGRWRWGGVCPGWWLIAHHGRLYCQRGSEILTRRADDRNASWERWGELPNLKSDEQHGFLAIAGDRIFAKVQPNGLCSKRLTEPSTDWHRESSLHPYWPNGFTGSGHDLFSNDQQRVLIRPADDESAPWKPIASWPKECDKLAIHGNQFLVVGGPGPIWSRPLSAGPDVAWSIVGRSQIPLRK